jgi:C-terminal processing protease CtpA/Prc
LGCEQKLFIDKKNDPVYVFDCFWQEIDRNYPFFTYNNLNWDSVYQVYRPKINSNTTEKELYQIISQAITSLNDIHTQLYAPYGMGGSENYFDKFPLNQIYLDDSLFNYYIKGRIYEYGILKNVNIGYIKIKTFDGEHNQFEYIDTVLNNLKAVKGLVIDVRSNRGGILSNSITAASRFTDTSRMVLKYRVRNGKNHSDFTNWNDLYLLPAKKGSCYSKPVSLLTNRQSISATEYFVLFTRQLPNFTVIGDTTCGGSSPIYSRELPNSWIISTSNRQTLTPEGYDFQFTGLYPDIPVWIKKQDEEKGIDTILETAIDWLLSLNI